MTRPPNGWLFIPAQILAFAPEVPIVPQYPNRRLRLQGRPLPAFAHHTTIGAQECPLLWPRKRSHRDAKQRAAVGGRRSALFLLCSDGADRQGRQSTPNEGCIR